MAIKNNQGTKTQQQVAKVYATDEAGMMADAKEYAKRDYQIVLATFNEMFKAEATDEQKKNLAESLVAVKYKQIVDARITNRVTYFD